MLPVAIILLAAGNSSRLGRPKQLLAYGPNTLLRHAAETAVGAALGPVIVVVGAFEEQCRVTLQGLPVTIVTNPAWHEGMGTSIAVGAQELNADKHRAAIVMLCDQPAITTHVLQSLDEHQRASGASMVACRWADTLGSPALFTARHFPELRCLQGQQGAKSLFQNLSSLNSLECPAAAWDIDTEADLPTLQNR